MACSAARGVGSDHKIAQIGRALMNHLLRESECHVCNTPPELGRKSLKLHPGVTQTTQHAAATPRCYSAIGFPGWPHRPRQRVRASRWPLVGMLAQVWNICLLRFGRPAAVYRCKTLKRPSTGATGEGKATLPTRPDAALSNDRAEHRHPNTRHSRRVLWEMRTGPPDFTGHSRRAPRSMAWTGCQRRHVRAR